MFWDWGSTESDEGYWQHFVLVLYALTEISEIKNSFS
jgi:hypothetical protein